MAAHVAAYEVHVRSLCGGNFPRALRLADRLDPQRWKLEWHVAAWLGESFGVAPEICDEITLSNLLGLSSLRLRDDIADGEAATIDIPGSPEQLAGQLYEAALAVYRRRFPPSSPLWPQAERSMNEWVSATLMPGGNLGARQLAMRGAPLKIPAFAVCLLAGREDDFAEVERSLDHALTAMVLYDHIVDWREDVAAGRWNAFVAAALEAMRPRAQIATARGVAVALLTTNVIETQFSLIADELSGAAAVAEQLGVHRLASHLRTTRDSLDRQGHTMAVRYHELAERGKSLMFRDYPQKAA